MKLDEARKFLNGYGYELVENDIGVERNIKNLFTKNGWNLLLTAEMVRMFIKILMLLLEM